MRTRYLCSVVATLIACGDSKVPTTLDVQDVNVTTMEDTPINVIVPVSTNRPLLTVSIKTPPSHGTLSVCSTTSATMPCSGASADDKTQYQYQPAVNYDGPDTVVLTLDNGDLQKDATVHITVTAVNDPPVANTDSFAAKFNTMAQFDDATLLANDTDVDSTALTVVSVTPAAHGTPSHAGTQVTFIPEANYQGAGSFTYVISDGTATATGTVNVMIGANSAPIAVADTIAATEDTVATIPAAMLLTNDSDPDHQTLAVSTVSAPTHGTVQLSNGMITFTPDANYNGVATFQYGVTDGADITTATVTLNIAPVNDPPVVPGVSITVTEDQVLSIPAATLLAGATDVDGDTLHIVGVKNAQHCTVTLGNLLGDSVNLVPDPNFNGAASFTYTVSDGTASVDVGASVTVTAVNDAPVAVADVLNTTEDVAVTVPAASLAANDTDADGDSLSVASVLNATGGTVSLLGGNVTFTPNLHFHAIGTFDYTVTDGQLTSTGHVTVNVAHLNHAPVAINDQLTTNEDTAVVGSVLLNDMDVDGDTLSVSAVSQGSHGTVTFAATTVTYTPATLFSGTDSFTYVASDGHGGNATATVTVTVNFVNHAPTAVADNLTTLEDTVGSTNVLANDSDAEGDTMTVTASTPGTHGTTVVLAGGVIQYTPDKDFNGGDVFHYTVTDGTSTATGTVNVTVTPVNDAPVAFADTYTGPANDTDVDNLVLTAIIVSPPSCGMVSLNPDGGFFYLTNGECANDAFTYKAFDGLLSSAPVTVTVKTTPFAVDDSYTTDFNGSFCTEGCCFQEGFKKFSKSSKHRRVDMARPTATSVSHALPHPFRLATAVAICGSQSPLPPSVADFSVSIIKGTSGNVFPGDDVEYTINVNGPGPSCNAGLVHPQVSASFPMELSNIQWSCFGSGCTAVSGSGDINQVLAMSTSDSVQFAVFATVAGSPGDDIFFAANITGSDYTDPVSPGPNTATASNFVASRGLQDNDLPPNAVMNSVLVDAPAGGTVTMCPRGGFDYESNSCGTFTDTFTYIDDWSGNLSNVATVTISVNCD